MAGHLRDKLPGAVDHTPLERVLAGGLPHTIQDWFRLGGPLRIPVQLLQDKILRNLPTLQPSIQRGPDGAPHFMIFYQRRGVRRTDIVVFASVAGPPVRRRRVHIDEILQHEQPLLVGQPAGMLHHRDIFLRPVHRRYSTASGPGGQGSFKNSLASMITPRSGGVLTVQ